MKVSLSLVCLLLLLFPGLFLVKLGFSTGCFSSFTTEAEALLSAEVFLFFTCCLSSFRTEEEALLSAEVFDFSTGCCNSFANEADGLFFFICCLSSFSNRGRGFAFSWGFRCLNWLLYSSSQNMKLYRIRNWKTWCSRILQSGIIRAIKKYSIESKAATRFSSWEFFYLTRVGDFYFIIKITSFNKKSFF